MTQESVLTIVEKGDLQVIVHRDPNGRQVFYKTIPMDADDLQELFNVWNKENHD